MERRRAGRAGKGGGSAGRGRGRNHRGGGGGGRGLGTHHGDGGYDNRPSVPAVAAGGRGGGRGRGTHRSYLTGLPYFLVLVLVLVLVLARNPQEEEVLGLVYRGVDRLLLHLLRQLVNSFGCESPPLSGGGDCSPQKYPQDDDNPHSK